MARSPYTAVIHLDDGMAVRILFPTEYLVENEDGRRFIDPELKHYLTQVLTRLYDDPFGKELLRRYVAESGRIRVASAEEIARDVPGAAAYLQPGETMEIVLPLTRLGWTLPQSEIGGHLAHELVHGVTEPNFSINEEMFAKLLAEAVRVRAFNKPAYAKLEDILIHHFIESERTEDYYRMHYTLPEGDRQADAGLFYRDLLGLDTDVLAYLQEANAMMHGAPWVDRTQVPAIAEMRNLTQIGVLLDEVIAHDGEEAPFETASSTRLCQAEVEEEIRQFAAVIHGYTDYFSSPAEPAAGEDEPEIEAHAARGGIGR